MEPWVSGSAVDTSSLARTTAGMRVHRRVCAPTSCPGPVGRGRVTNPVMLVVSVGCIDEGGVSI